MEGTLKGAPLGWDVTRAHKYKRIPGAPGVPLFPELGGSFGYGDVGARPQPGPPPPETPLPSPEAVAQAGAISRARDAAEVKERESLEVKAFLAGLDWNEIAVATIPAIISGYVLARIIRR